MLWVLGLLALIVVLAVPALRAVAGCLLVIGIVLVLALFGYLKIDENNREAAAAAAKRIIQPTQVQFDNVTLSGGGYSWTLKGKLTNNSPATVTRFEYRVRVCDPASAQGRCDVVADKTEDIYLEVPPGQSRYFDEFVIFTPTPHIPQGWTWWGSLVSISGKR